MIDLHDQVGAELDAATLYAILRLRAEVFVVEQGCAYADLDGRDLLPGVRHCWIEEAGRVLAYLRIRPDPGGFVWLGRVCTAVDARGQGLAGSLVDHALGSTAGPVRLLAQTYLTDWYAGYGFRLAGEPFDEDGISHVEMRLER